MTDDKSIQLVYSCGGGSYDWAEVALYINVNTAEITYKSGRGCSCDSIEEYDPVILDRSKESWDKFQAEVESIGDEYADASERTEFLAGTRRFMDHIDSLMYKKLELGELRSTHEYFR
jgi:hypothetical protein